jgi:hypothetical protein
VSAVFVVACGSGEEQPADATPAATSTAQAEDTPQAEPTAASPPQVISTPQLVTPAPADSVRDDCPDGWAVADEPGFSFCYPPELEVVRAERGAFIIYNLNSPRTITGERPPDPISIVLAEDTVRSFNPQRGCDGITPLSKATLYEEVTVGWSNGSQIACASTGSDHNDPFEAFIMDIPLGQHLMHLRALYGVVEDNARALVRELIATLVLR